MSTSSNVVKLAPYFTAQLLLVPGAFATHLETYTQYANTKGADALWLQETLDPMLIKTLRSRHKIEFKAKVAQGESESEADFCKRRLDDARETAQKIFQLIAPHGTKDSADFVVKECRFKFLPDVSISLQVSMHETKFEARIAQLNLEHTSEDELAKIYLRCLSMPMQKELKLWGKARGKSKWRDFASRSFEMAEAIENAEHFRRLFGMAQADPKPAPKEKEKQPRDPADGGGRGGGKGDKGGRGGDKGGRGGGSGKKTCHECGSADHLRPECPLLEEKRSNRPPATGSASLGASRQQPPAPRAPSSYVGAVRSGMESTNRPGTDAPRRSEREGRGGGVSRYSPSRAGSRPTMASLVAKMNDLNEWPDTSAEMAAVAVEIQQLVADGGADA